MILPATISNAASAVLVLCGGSHDLWGLSGVPNKRFEKTQQQILEDCYES